MGAVLTSLLARLLNSLTEHPKSYLGYKKRTILALTAPSTVAKLMEQTKTGSPHGPLDTRDPRPGTGPRAL